MKFKDTCPNCKSENFDMTGDPEFNDGFTCNDCGNEFNSFDSKEVGRERKSQ